MDTQQQGIITLIRSALTGESYSLPVEFDLEQAYPELVRHQVATMAYEGAVRCGVDKQLPIMQTLFRVFLQHLLHSERQMQAVKQLCETYEKAGIEYLLLKGCNLKKLYPKPELRQMGDADILIRSEQYGRIKPIMEELGFDEKETGPYDYTWDSPQLHSELHYRLASPADIDFLRYFGDGWQRAKRKTADGYCFEYSDEDQFIYLFMHFAKHYRDSGIGLKHAADLWVYHRAMPDLDKVYLETELKKLHLWDFYLNVLRMIELWFSGECMDERSKYILDVIFRSGAFGTHKNFTISSAVRASKISGSSHSAKAWQIFRLVFPAYENLCVRYDILKKYPVLLPVIWAVRWFRILFFQREKIGRQRNELSIATPDKIETYQQALHYVGLDFHFKE